MHLSLLPCVVHPPPYIPLFGRSNNIWRKVQINKLLVQFSAAYYSCLLGQIFYVAFSSQKQRMSVRPSLWMREQVSRICNTVTASESVKLLLFLFFLVG
jgi:hypothetical protein